MSTTDSKGFVFYGKRIVGAVLLVTLSAVFFYSAYTKSGIAFRGWHLVTNDNAFDSFQWTFLDLGITNIIAAGIIARVFIGLELMLGLFLLFHVFLRKFTYPAVIAILAAFIVYLLVVIARQGNHGNCGCFGNSLEMTPMQAIVKNILMIGGTLVLMKIYPVRPYRFQEYLLLGLMLVAFSAPFLFNNVFIGTNPDTYTKSVDLAPLYQYAPAPEADLRKGRQIVAFMSLTCPHCKKAAYLMHVIHDQHPDFPFYIVLYGDSQFVKPFFDETHAADVPHLYYNHPSEFMTMAGPGVPAIYWFENGRAAYKSTYAYYQLDPGFISSWLHAAH